MPAHTQYDFQIIQLCIFLEEHLYGAANARNFPMKKRSNYENRGMEMYHSQSVSHMRDTTVPPLHHHETNVMKVTGEAEIAVQPDKATVTLGAITENKVLKEAQQLNSQIVSSIIQSLLMLGIPKEQIKTIDYRIETEYDYSDGKQVFRGYRVTHLLAVEIKDLSMIGNVVDQAVESGANYVSNIQFTSSKKNQFYLQALQVAVFNAGQKAETLANALNVRLNPTPFLITEGKEEQRPIYDQSVTYVKGVSTTTIEPGQITISAVVNAKFHYNS
jgi:uncharacterized protein